MPDHRDIVGRSIQVDNRVVTIYRNHLVACIVTKLNPKLVQCRTLLMPNHYWLEAGIVFNKRPTEIAIVDERYVTLSILASED